MATTKHRGRKKLVKRLAAQVGSETLAKNILKKRGHLDKDGKLTKAGKARDKMTASERAKQRAAKRSGKSSKAYKYNPKTNTATLKGK
tara:strand:- start:227 stop:490 length:264 start_codon:yes stop_codon:yes gene_type:complete